MIPEKPQHRSKLIASNERMTMLVISVINSSRPFSAIGAATITARTATSMKGSIRSGRRRPPRFDDDPLHATLCCADTRSLPAQLLVRGLYASGLNGHG